MSWFARLLGRAPAAAPVAPTTVVLPDDLAAALTAAGMPLQEAVEAALRAHLAALAQVAARGGADSRIPFWLARDAEGGAAIEEALRGRMAQRRAAEEEEGGASRRGRRPRDADDDG